MSKWDLSNFDNKEDAHVGFQQVPESRTSVDNILRLNYNNQLRLTLMADTKANIMITVSSIVFSITVANITNEMLLYPLMALGICSVVALVCAITVSYTHLTLPTNREV